MVKQLDNESRCVQASSVMNRSKSNKHNNTITPTNTHTCARDVSDTQIVYAPIPTSYSELRRRIFSGKNALPPMLNQPTVKKAFGHAVISNVRECIYDLMCGDISPECLIGMFKVDSAVEDQKVRSIHECEFVRSKIKQIQERQKGKDGAITRAINIVAMLWGDDFQGNNTKQDRANMHVKTLTFVLVNGDERTYPIQISQKGIIIVI